MQKQIYIYLCIYLFIYFVYPYRTPVGHQTVRDTEASACHMAGLTITSGALRPPTGVLPDAPTWPAEVGTKSLHVPASFQTLGVKGSKQEQSGQGRPTKVNASQEGNAVHQLAHPQS
jgi:hypothetical protein